MDCAVALRGTTLSSEKRLAEATTELQGVKNELAHMKRVDIARCATVLHQQSIIESLVVENGSLKRRLHLMKFGRFLGDAVLFAACFILWFVRGM